MKILTTSQQLTDFFHQNRVGIGFVPTMGALHEGHLSLIRRAQKENALVVVSVFVNPTQFNDAEDYNTYPKTFDEDKQLLTENNVDVMFFPSVKEIYPSTINFGYDLDGLDEFMEGPNRPGHFNGVVQVVARLFDLVKPHRAYFGNKDFQQLAIIRHMTNKLGYKIEIVGCETIREANGLAMSSRNRKLSAQAREQANIIHRSLLSIKDDIEQEGVFQAKANAISMIESVPSIKIEYLELVDPQLLKPVDHHHSGAIHACVAVRMEGVRLIDNMQVK